MEDVLRAEARDESSDRGRSEWKPGQILLHSLEVDQERRPGSLGGLASQPLLERCEEARGGGGGISGGGTQFAEGGQVRGVAWVQVAADGDQNALPQEPGHAMMENEQEEAVQGDGLSQELLPLRVLEDRVQAPL